VSPLRAVTALAIAMACGGTVGCRTPGAAPVGSPLVRHTRLAPIVPDEADHAAANLAAAALVSDRAWAARELETIEKVDRGRRRGDLPPTGLGAQAEDLLNATIFGGRSYREATETLLDRDDLSKELRARLERDHADDPLALANARVHDARMIQVARLFNAVSEPAGHSILTATFAPYKFAQSAVSYVIQVASDDPLPLQRRQALAHWKRFLARYPDAEESPTIARRVDSAEKRWHQTQRDHALYTARRALSKGRSRLALFHAERALRHVPEDRASDKVRTRAAKQVRAEEERVRWSVQFEPEAAGPLLPAGSRELAVAMLDPNGDLEEAARALPQDNPLQDELRFARATLRGEAGDDTGMWSDPNMLRHAQAELGDSLRNPYDGFQRARRRDRRGQTIWVLLGPAAVRPEWSLTGVAEWLIRLPSRLQAVVTPLPRAARPSRPYRPDATWRCVPAGSAPRRCGGGSKTTSDAARTGSARCASRRNAPSRAAVRSRSCARRPQSRPSAWRPGSAGATCATPCSTTSRASFRTRGPAERPAFSPATRL
jgi:hypothetical protein